MGAGRWFTTKSKGPRKTKAKKAKAIAKANVHKPQWPISTPLPVGIKKEILHYSSSFSCTMNAGNSYGAATFVYAPSVASGNVNSLNSATGIPYLTQIKALYKRYRIDKVSYSGRIHQSSGTPADFGMVFINGAVPAFSSVSSYNDLLFSKFDVCVAYQPIRKFAGSVKMHTVLGVPELEYKTADRFQGTFTADPAEIVSLMFYASNVYSSGQSIYAEFKITLELELMDPIVLTT